MGFLFGKVAFSWVISWLDIGSIMEDADVGQIVNGTAERKRAGFASIEVGRFSALASTCNEICVSCTVPGRCCTRLLRQARRFCLHRGWRLATTSSRCRICRSWLPSYLG